MNILQDVKQNQFHQPARMSKCSSGNNSKKIASSKFGGGYEVQMQIGITYNQILQIIKQNGLNKQLNLPQDGIKSIQKLSLIKSSVQFLVNQLNKNGSINKQSLKNQQNQCMDQSNMINCVDCQNYQNNLQKLQNEVRQHIRLQQQLKIYQESMQQKIQELKKEKTHFDKKYDDLKKKYEQQKHNSNGFSQKMHKLQFENQKLKADVKQLKQSPLESSKRIKGYQSRDKQNRIDWVHRMSSINKKDEKQANKFEKEHLKDKIQITHTDRNTERTVGTDKQRTDRKLMQKRGDSSDRWRMSGAKSTKIINFNEKIIQQKNKEQRKKAIQSKFEYRR